MKFEILEHKADLKVRVFGKDLKEVFENAMIGMFEGAKYESELKTKSGKRKISIKSMNLSSLLVDFLSEILYLVETEKEVYQKVDFKKLSDSSAGSEQAEIEAVLIGKKLKRIGVHVKAVTYHELDIRQVGDKIWQATILFDI